MTTFVSRITESAILPTRGSAFAAGLDLYADEDVLIEPGCRRLVGTGVAVAIPSHLAGLVWPRSGLATRGITTDAGVIDADYRGEVRVLLVNHATERFEVLRGMRIAQLVIQPVFPDIREVDVLPIDTGRGEGGFGSTGS